MKIRVKIIILFIIVGCIIAGLYARHYFRNLRIENEMDKIAEIYGTALECEIIKIIRVEEGPDKKQLVDEVHEFVKELIGLIRINKTDVNIDVNIKLLPEYEMEFKLPKEKAYLRFNHRELVNNGVLSYFTAKNTLSGVIELDYDGSLKIKQLMDEKLNPQDTK